MGMERVNVYASVGCISMFMYVQRLLPPLHLPLRENFEMGQDVYKFMSLLITSFSYTNSYKHNYIIL